MSVTDDSLNSLVEAWTLANRLQTKKVHLLGGPLDGRFAVVNPALDVVTFSRGSFLVSLETYSYRRTSESTQGGTPIYKYCQP